MTDSTPFRIGIRVAMQLIVDDIAGVVQRRQRMSAPETTTSIMVGIARRIATLPMPSSPDDAPPFAAPPITDHLTEEQIETAGAALLRVEQEIAGIPPEDRHSWAEIPHEEREHRVRMVRAVAAALVLP